MRTEQIAANLKTLAASLEAMGAPTSSQVLLEARTKLLALDGDHLRADDRRGRDYRLWVDDSRTLLVRLWLSRDDVEVARRGDTADTWGPPVYLTEEK